jgi:hydroxypyruvate isomerase
MLKFSANISVLFRELPLLQRFAAARESGFAAVEIQVPYEVPAAALASAAAAAGVSIVLINAPMGPDRSPGMACRREHRELFSAELDRAVEYAAALQVPCVNVLAGRAAAHERPECLAQLSESLASSATALAAVGARVLLEPINPLDVPDYCVPNFELAAHVLAPLGGRVGLQFDIYHAARLGLQPELAFEQYAPLISHVQFADAPGRHEPGTGTLPFRRIFQGIEQSGYRGWLGAEYHPSGASDSSLGWLREYRALGNG